MQPAPLRILLVGADTPLGVATSAVLRAAGHEFATAASRADAIVLLDDVATEPLAAASEILVGRTCALLDAMPAAVKRVVIATAADVLGEGPGECSACGRVRPDNRPADVLAPWEPRCPRCEGALVPAAVREDERVQPATPLAALRLSREDLVLAWGRDRGIAAVSLRMFELYGPGRADGVIGSMASAIRSGRAPDLAEDGLQTRDFLHLRDAARAIVLAVTHGRAAGHIFNVGSGKGSRLSSVAAALVVAAGAAVEVRPSGTHRRGEERHLTAETMKIRHTLGWRPEVAMGAGLKEVMGDSVVRQE